MMSFNDFEDAIYKKVHKVITHFLYSDDVHSLRKMAREQVRQDIIGDLKRLCNESNRLFSDPKTFGLREEDFNKLIKRWEEW